MGEISEKMLCWYDLNKRVLPWRDMRDPYKTWISEIMLQQTRVETVLNYYQRFIKLFPSIQALANAPQEQLLKAWEGLGYYSRVRNMQKAAKIIMQEHNGVMPSDVSQLITLPGIGAYTSGAISSIAFGQKTPALDGNAIRVFVRLFNIDEDTSLPSTQKKLYQIALNQLDDLRPGDFNQAIMDLGSAICLPGTPDCLRCPMHSCCMSFQEGEPENLPVRTQKTTPKVMEYGVAIVFCGDEVLVRKRPETLLHGLFTFYMAKDCLTPEAIQRIFLSEKIAISLAQPAVHSRHVFTHRIWEMENMIFITEKKKNHHECIWVPADQLDDLPIPTAMKVAKKMAQEFVKSRIETR